MTVQTIEEVELLRRINWFIRLRWLAALAVFLAGWLAKKIFPIDYPQMPLYLTALIIAIYNTIFYILAQNLEKKSSAELIVKNVRSLANFQISFDLIALTVLIYFTGGIENPFIFYFIFHIIISSILLSTRVTYIQATLSVFLLTTMAVLQYYGVIPHIQVKGYGLSGLYANKTFLIGNLFVFITTIYVSAYIATSITRRLRKRQREIIELKEDLEEKTKMLAEINEKLLKLDNLKTRFLSMASHDLKSPLGAVESYLRIILGGFVGDVVPKQKELLERSSLRIKELLKLINDLLDISSIEKGQIIQEMEKVSLREIVEKSVEDIKSSAEEKGLEIQVTMPEDPMFLNAAGDRLEEVFINLLSNAVKFTPEGGRIILSILEDSDSFKIRVEDTGIGVPREEQSKIFKDFYQASNVETKKIKGAGLGLSIVKQIIEAHQGKIWMESELGKGAKFFFTLPKEQGSK